MYYNISHGRIDWIARTNQTNHTDESDESHGRIGRITHTSRTKQKAVGAFCSMLWPWCSHGEKCTWWRRLMESQLPKLYCWLLWNKPNFVSHSAKSQGWSCEGANIGKTQSWFCEEANIHTGPVREPVNTNARSWYITSPPQSTWLPAGPVKAAGTCPHPDLTKRGHSYTQTC